MNRLFKLSTLVAGALLLALGLPSPAQAQKVRRFAVVVANNEGGAGMPRLYYAHEDARRVREVLDRLGGVQGDDLILLLDGKPLQVRRALSELSSRVLEAGRAGEQTLLVFYYSGHAKDGVLRLGEGRLPIEDLKARLDAVPADVRIGILDSCRSGLATRPDRSKGAYRAPAFEVEVGEGGRARGTVLLTSSSADEDSQESDHLGGSYFTHHLVNGLQGDADESGDGRITLSEAYGYAYARTVASTAETSAGPQHPTFSYDLSGKGDVVLTDVARRREGVVLAASAPEGTYYLVDREGRVRAEISKLAGQQRRVGVAPGRYKVKRRLEDRLRIGSLVVEKGQATTLDESALRDAPFSDDPVKGPGRRGPGSRTSILLSTGWQSTFQAPDASLFPAVPMIEVGLERRGDLGRGWVWGPSISMGFATATTPALAGGLPYTYRDLMAGAALMREWPGRLITPFVGGTVSWRFYLRSFDDPALPSQFFSTFTPGLVAGGRLRLSRGFCLGLRGRLSYLHYNIDENLSLGLWDLSATLGYQP